MDTIKMIAPLMDGTCRGESKAPSAPGVKPYDLWTIHLVDKVLAEYHAVTGDERALRAVERSLRIINARLERQPRFNWGRYRWFEALIPAFHLYEPTGEICVFSCSGRKAGSRRSSSASRTKRPHRRGLTKRSVRRGAKRTGVYQPRPDIRRAEVKAEERKRYGRRLCDG